LSSELTLIIFDCDGTISDSQHMICTSMAMAFETHGLNAPSHEAVRSSVGLSPVQAVVHLLPSESDIDPVILVQSFRDSYNELIDLNGHTEVLYDGALGVIGALAQIPAVLLGIATGNSQRGVARLLTHFGVTHPFCTIQTADDAPSKPHPAMLSQAMAATGIEAHCTIMVGDTTYDMEMAVNAGVYPLGVAWGYHSVEMLEGAGAKYVATDYTDLSAHITEVHL